MITFKRIIMWLALLAIGLLIALSILGAFFGSDKAQAFFNTIPLTVYWFFFVVLLIAGFIWYPTLLFKPTGLMIHLGCLLILIGSLWASQAGHNLNKRFFGKDKIARGFMLITEGNSEKNVTSADFERILGYLPFSLKLKDFRLEYYPSDKDFVPTLDIRAQNDWHLRLPVRVGQEVHIGEGQGSLKVKRIFKNFKIRWENKKKIITDEEKNGEMPAVEVEVFPPDANSYTCYVFEHFGEVTPRKDSLRLSFAMQGKRIIKDYISDIVVIENGKEVATKSVEVNKPLHYGGYHFYQYSYDNQSQKYTILLVTSDNGLHIVYAGFWLLCLGVLWKFWFKRIPEFVKGNIS